MCQDIKNENRKGARIEDGKAHELDHQKWSRRGFIKNMGVAGSAGFLMGGFSIKSLLANPLAYALNCSDSDRIIVLIKLNGGNDGLNTVIPMYDYGRYTQLRPTIAISEQDTFMLDSEVALPNTMSSLQNLWNDGEMKVIHNVGYEGQNLSHFRSTDIWHTASDSNEVLNSGWIGRFLENEYPDYLTNPPNCPPAIEIGSSESLIFNNSDDLKMSVNFANAQRLQSIAEMGAYYDTINVPDCFYGEQLAFSRSIANTIYQYAEVINDAYTSAANGVAYPGDLGGQLSLVARLIKGNLNTQFYTVSLSSFDTHAAQNGSHPALLQNLADSVQAFFEDLGLTGHDKRVLCMTYSEFGRRAEQNASNGTDHGAAAPAFFFGPGLNGNGVLGDVPDLRNLDANGNLVYNTDFRQLYSSVLENWLCINAQTVDDVLGGTFNRLDDLGLTCMPVSNTEVSEYKFSYKIYHNGNGTCVVEYELPQSSKVEVSVYNMLGSRVATLYNGQKSKGNHRHDWRPPYSSSGLDYLICKLTVGGKVFSKPLVLKTP